MRAFLLVLYEQLKYRISIKTHELGSCTRNGYIKQYLKVEITLGLYEILCKFTSDKYISICYTTFNNIPLLKGSDI